MALTIAIGSILLLAWCVLVCAIFYSAGPTPSFLSPNDDANTIDNESLKELWGNTFSAETITGSNVREGTEMPVASNGGAPTIRLPEERHSRAETTLDGGNRGGSSKPLEHSPLSETVAPSCEGNAVQSFPAPTPITSNLASIPCNKGFGAASI